MTQDRELQEILEDLPVGQVAFTQTYDRANCWVTIGRDPQSGRPRLEIYPLTGGWLGVDLEHLQADVAPYHG